MGDRGNYGPIGPRIRELRKARGWSLSDLAERAGISRSYLFRIERGKSSPTYTKIQALAEALGVLPSELLGEKHQTDDIPQSLKDFADEEGLSSQQTQMLTHIEYRGEKPDSPKEWRAIYSIIKTMIEE